MGEVLGVASLLKLIICTFLQSVVAFVNTQYLRN